MPTESAVPPLESVSFYRSQPTPDFPLIFAWINGLGLVVTVGYLIWWTPKPRPPKVPGVPMVVPPQRLAKTVMALWLILPPVWFWCEYFGIFKVHGDLEHHFEHFKYGHELSAKIWAGMLAFLFAVYKLNEPDKE